MQSKTKKDNPVSNIALNNSIAYTDKKDIISLLLEQNDSNLYDINNKDDSILSFVGMKSSGKSTLIQSFVNKDKGIKI